MFGCGAAKALAKWQPDALALRVPHLTSLLNHTAVTRAAADAVVVYIHCTGGDDRTGELVASYGVSALGWDPNDAWQYNMAVSNRMLAPRETFAFRWFCYYLGATTRPDLTPKCNVSSFPACEPPIACGGRPPTGPGELY